MQTHSNEIKRANLLIAHVPHCRQTVAWERQEGWGWERKRRIRNKEITTCTRELDWTRADTKREKARMSILYSELELMNDEWHVCVCATVAKAIKCACSDQFFFCWNKNEFGLSESHMDTIKSNENTKWMKRFGIFVNDGAENVWIDHDYVRRLCPMSDTSAQRILTHTHEHVKVHVSRPQAMNIRCSAM